MKHEVTVEDVMKGLAVRWSEHPAISVCKKLARYVDKIGVQNAQYLSLTRLSHVVGKKSVDEELMIALNILSVNSPPLLHVAATLHVGGEQYDLDPDEVDAILSEDTVVHPVTGEMLKKASDLTEIYYTVSDEITESA